MLRLARSPLDSEQSAEQQRLHKRCIPNPTHLPSEADARLPRRPSDVVPPEHAILTRMLPANDLPTGTSDNVDNCAYHSHAVAHALCEFLSRGQLEPPWCHVVGGSCFAL
jgi:hypothetical protein